MKTLLPCLAITIFILGFSTLGMTIDDKSLILYYSFDEGKGDKVEDITKNGYIGTTGGKVGWEKNGKVGGAILFDQPKGGGFVRTPNEIKGFTSASLKEITVECWLQLLGITGDTQQLWEGLNAAGAWPAETFIEGNQAMTFYIYDDKGVAHQINTPSPLPLKQWVHIAGTYDGSKQKFYVDGKVVADTSWNGTFTIFAKGIALGKDNEADIQWLNGMVDEFAIYTRALTEAEIKQDMDKGVKAAAVYPAGKLATAWGKIKTQH